MPACMTPPRPRPSAPSGPAKRCLKAKSHVKHAEWLPCRDIVGHYSSRGCPPIFEGFDHLDQIGHFPKPVGHASTAIEKQIPHFTACLCDEQAAMARSSVRGAIAAGCPVDGRRRSDRSSRSLSVPMRPRGFAQILAPFRPDRRACPARRQLRYK